MDGLGARDGEHAQRATVEGALEREITVGAVSQIIVVLVFYTHWDLSDSGYLHHEIENITQTNRFHDK